MNIIILYTYIKKYQYRFLNPVLIDYTLSINCVCGILHVDPSPTAPTQAQRKDMAGIRSSWARNQRRLGMGLLFVPVANLVGQLLVELNPYFGGENPHL